MLLPQLSAELCQRGKAHELTPQSLANVLWSLAKLNAWNTTVVTELGGGAVVAAAADGFNARDLANTLWAFVEHGGFTAGNWPLFITMAVAATRRATAMPPQDLTNIVWAFAEVRPLSERRYEHCCVNPRVPAVSMRLRIGNVFECVE